jgi:thioredoxin 1
MMFMYVKVLIGAGIGLLSGGLMGHFGKCSSGACPLTANPLRGALFGMLLGAVLALMISTGGCRETASESPPKSDEHTGGKIAQVTTVEEFNSRVLRSDKPVLVDFHATWCGPCRLLAPTIDALAGEYAGRAEFVKVDGDQFPELLKAYNVQGYPTVLIFNGGKPVKTLIGLQKAGEYRAALYAATKPPERELQ